MGKMASQILIFGGWWEDIKEQSGNELYVEDDRRGKPDCPILFPAFISLLLLMVSFLFIGEPRSNFRAVWGCGHGFLAALIHNIGRRVQVTGLLSITHGAVQNLYPPLSILHGNKRKPMKEESPALSEGQGSVVQDRAPLSKCLHQIGIVRGVYNSFRTLGLMQQISDIIS